MSKRGSVSDYAGDEIRVGDLVTYGSRRGNMVRLADGKVLKVYTRKGIGGKVYPRIKVEPTGDESGWVPSRSMRIRNIGIDHVRLVRTAEELAQ
jgi:hypothetical protein